MSIVLAAIRLITAGVLAAGLVFLADRSLAQLQGELDFQTARHRNGIEQIQTLHSVVKDWPEYYEPVKHLAQSYARNGYQNQALEYRHQAVGIRPSWPFAWHDLAVAYSDNQLLISSGFTLALRNSRRLGSHEVSLQKARMRLAIRLLGQPMQESAERELYEALSDEFEKAPGRVYARAALWDREAVVCDRLGKLDGVKKWCAEMEYFRDICAEEVVKLKKHRDWCVHMRQTWESWL